MGALPVLLIIGAVVALSLLWLSIRVVKLRNLKSLVEIGVDKNTTVVFPAPLMSTITDLGVFLQREQQSAHEAERDAVPRARAAASSMAAAPAHAVGGRAVPIRS